MSRWERLQEHFHAVLALPAPERPEYLERLEQDDPELKLELVELLRAEALTQTGASPAVLRSAAGYLESLDDQLIGERVGNYQLTAIVGSGGMGTVYRASRADGSFDRDVALKVVKRGMDTGSVLQRFEQERQLLAQLSHPNIANLLDAGETEDGRPYYVMEFVDGEPLLDYCDEQRLSIRKRLRLFGQICGAVQYAHQHLIVHRDLKPSNILIDESGTPKLLDFGIAKPLDTQEGLTRTGSMPFTPAYAAPEQLRGDRISTATDIYALGVVLYELLSGRRPFDPVKGESTFVEEILTSDPERPSTRLTRAPAEDPALAQRQDSTTISAARSTALATLKQQLKGDLDLICLHALRREPSERYPSAAALAADLAAHLAEQPVSARPPSLAYQLGKFYRRNRWLVVGSGAAVALFFASTTYYTVRVTEERDRAILEQARTAEVVDFVTGLFSQSDPSYARGEEVTARELLDAGLRDVDTRLEGRPAIRGKMLEVLGSVYYELGDFERGKELLERALEAQENASAEPLDLATTRLALGVVEQTVGNYERAGSLFDSALALRTEALGPDDPAVREVLGAQGFLAETEGQFDEAEALFREALALARNNARGQDDESLAVAMKELAGVLRLLDRSDEAEPLLRDAIAMQERLYGGAHPELDDSKRQLAGLLRDAARPEEAQTLYEEVIASRTKMLGEDHREVQNTWNSYAQLLLYMENLDGALAAFNQVVASVDRVRKGKPHVSLPALHHNRAFTLRKMQRFAEAEAGYQAAIAGQDEIGMDPEHPNRTYPLAALGQLYLEWGKPTEAQPILRSVLATRRQHFPEDHRLINEVKNDLGATLSELGEYPEAERLLLEANEAISAKRPEHHPDVQANRYRLRQLYERMGQPERAKAFPAVERPKQA